MKIDKNNYCVLGVMSGTSTDGLDLAVCNFETGGGAWKFNILDARTFPYNNNVRNKLHRAHILSTSDFLKFHNEFGKLIGEKILYFLENKPYKIDFISSHGHTIYHQPSEHFTYQIGSGASIAAVTKIPVICDFRSMDVALGGQGAPLVPVGDEILFKQYDYCINLGGIANISYNEDNRRLAFDICPVNIVINYLVRSVEKDFDNKGKIAKVGKVNQDLLHDLNRIEYYEAIPPKSLGREYIERNILPIVNLYDISLNDKLRTFYEHVAIQIFNVVKHKNEGSVMFTGGGVNNDFLMELIKKYISDIDIVIPDKQIIDFKEALIFAFLGVLNIRNEINCLASVTGASEDSVGGVLYNI